MTLASLSIGRQGHRVKEELNRNGESTRSSSRETPVSSTEGDYDEEEDDDDDVEEDEDEEDDEEEEEEREPEKVRFDERFLAQLLAFDPSLGSQNASFGSNIQSTSLLSAHSFNEMSHNDKLQTSQQQRNLESVPFPLSDSVPPIDTTARQNSSSNTFLPPSAPTPSNEFYDGAINFLTEVLGSSTPSFWNGDTGLANSAGDMSWMNQGKTPITAPGPQVAGTDFKNLQPLIGNLIARLKGLPVQDGQQSGQKLEDDLVVLLQSLMAHRQAQQNRQAQEQLNQSFDLLQQSSSFNNPTANIANFASSTSVSNQQQVENINNKHNTTSTQMFPSQPGFSIVDFDFGDDDDDPDFVPNNVNLDFVNSQDFADALAKVSAAPVAPLPSNLNERESARDGMSLNVDDASWQRVMDSLQTTNAIAASKMEEGPSVRSPSFTEKKARRTRSTTRNVDLPNERQNGETQKESQRNLSFSKIGLDIDQESDEDHSEANEEEGRENGRPGEKKRGRKALSKEEALERRRETNRECSRRSRMRKKQEEEEIRQEFVRMRNLRSVSQETGTIYGDSKDLTDLPAGLRKKKKGRPFGSKSFAKTDENAQAENEEQVADLRADNRMLRAEMQRLIEENAQLRARMLHYEEDRTDRGVKSTKPWTGNSNKGSALSASREYYLRGEEDDDDDEISDEEFMARSRAARDLPYDPSRIFQPPSSSRRSTQDQRMDSRGSKRRRAEDGSRMENLLSGYPAYQRGGNPLAY